MRQFPRQATEPCFQPYDDERQIKKSKNILFLAQVPPEPIVGTLSRMMLAKVEAVSFRFGSQLEAR